MISHGVEVHSLNVQRDSVGEKNNRPDDDRFLRQISAEDNRSPADSSSDNRAKNEAETADRASRDGSQTEVMTSRSIDNEDFLLSDAELMQSEIVNPSEASGASQPSESVAAELFDQHWYATGKLSYSAKSAYEVLASETGVTAESTAVSQGGKSNTRSAMAMPGAQNASSSTAATSSSLVDMDRADRHKSSATRSGNVSAWASEVSDYLKKKITFMEKDKTLNVFVRDYQLSDNEKMELVSRLKEFSQATEKNIHTILINGQEYFIGSEGDKT